MCFDKVSHISPQKFTFLFLSQSFIDVQCMIYSVFHNSNITHPLSWILYSDGIILLVLHFPIVCFTLVLINYKQDRMHVWEALWVILLFTGDYNKGENKCELWSHLCSSKMSTLPQSNTHKVKINFKAIHKHSGIKSQFQSYSKIRFK